MTYVYVRKGWDQFGGDPKTMTKSTLVARFMFVPSFSSSAFFPTYVEMLCPTATQDPIGTSPLKRGKLPSKALKSMLPTWSSVTPRASKTGTKRGKKKERKSQFILSYIFPPKRKEEKAKRATDIWEIQHSFCSLSGSVEYLCPLTRQRAKGRVWKTRRGINALRQSWKGHCGIV